MTIEPFRPTIEKHDLDAIMEVFADEVTFHSPIVFKTYHGRAELRFANDHQRLGARDFRPGVRSTR